MHVGGEASYRTIATAKLGTLARFASDGCMPQAVRGMHQLPRLWLIFTRIIFANYFYPGIISAYQNE